MPRFSKYNLFLVLTLAIATAEAMPIGVRIAVNGRAAAQEAVNALFPALDGEVSAADVANALAEAEDVALAENITDAAGYAEFREWAKCTGAVDVKASGKAWLSYALGADALIGKEITSNEFTVSPPADAGNSFFMRVKVK